MRSSFTPGAERALVAAAGWNSCDDSDELGLPEVLLGLLAEPECRAALMLAGFDVDDEATRRGFPTLKELPNRPTIDSRPFSACWSTCLRAVEDLLLEYPRPLELATEHLLLGLMATENEVSRWLAEQGLSVEALEAEVHRLSGHQPGPLPLAPLDIDQDLTPAEVGVNLEIAPTRPSTDAMPESAQTAALRILDAAANRAGEGLRVIEDYLRFDLDDRHLTGLCKSIRHELTAALSVYSSASRHAARETRADVGTSVSLPAEQSRSDLAAVLAANFKRVEQSLRSLEEYSKTLAPETAAAIEQLRYRVYTLERVVDVSRGSLQRLADVRLYVLIDGGHSEKQFTVTAESLVLAGVSMLQLRDKRLADRELLERGRLLREITRRTKTLFIMNDRPDLAVLCDADGVHVGQEELTVKDARRILGAEGLIGVSTHSIEQARAAVLDGADYIGVGPTFPSRTKKFSEFTGTVLLRRVAEEIRLPAFAIGGIMAENLSEVLATGFTRVAVSEAVTKSSDPAAAAAQFLERLN